MPNRTIITSDEAPPDWHARAHRLGDLHAAVSRLVEAHSLADVDFVLDAIREEIATGEAIADHARGSGPDRYPANGGR